MRFGQKGLTFENLEVLVADRDGFHLLKPILDIALRRVWWQLHWLEIQVLGHWTFPSKSDLVRHHLSGKKKHHGTVEIMRPCHRERRLIRQ